jgi:hypothetical protein
MAFLALYFDKISGEELSSFVPRKMYHILGGKVFVPELKKVFLQVEIYLVKGKEN